MLNSLMMGKSELDINIEKATNENNVTEDWALYMDIIDYINQKNSEKEALRLLTRRLNDRDPHVSIHALSLLNACVKNCNKSFKLEVCSRTFIEAAKQLITTTNHPKLSEKFASMIKSWCNEPEFQNDPALNLMQTLYIELVRNGVNFGIDESEKKTMKASSQSAALKKEEDDLAKAIALSIKESTSSQSLNKQNSSSKSQDSSNTSSLFGSINLNTRSNERRKVKALYDFEAVEDNEITFKTGDILFVTDSSDQNWWKGIDENNKEGLFPSNFVTSDLDYVEEQFESNSNTKKVSFNDDVNEKVVENDGLQKKIQILIDEKKIDDCIELLQNADPTGEIQPDTQEMLQLEDQCYMMGPLIDQQLQKIDYKHAILDDLNIKIIEAFQMYNNLMKESISKTTSFVPPQANNFNVNMNMPNQNYIPFVAAPPQTDANLSNQLNNFVNYNPSVMLPGHLPNEQIPQQTIPQDQFNTSQQGFQNYNMYQQPSQYGQIPNDSNNQNNMMSNAMFNTDLNNAQQSQPQMGQYNTVPNQ